MERRRRSIRLPAYDYGQAGAYFVTICTYQRKPLFGRVVEGNIRLNAVGRVAESEWLRTPHVRLEIGLDDFVLMPNHLHGIVVIVDDRAADEVAPVGAHGRAPLQRPARSLGSLIAGYKAASAKRINILRGSPGAPVWQRNYYEHIVRNERERDRIREYIRANPFNWDQDEYNPAVGTPAPAARRKP